MSVKISDFFKNRRRFNVIAEHFCFFLSLRSFSSLSFFKSPPFICCHLAPFTILFFELSFAIVLF